VAGHRKIDVTLTNSELTTLVAISSKTYGDVFGVARGVSSTGILIEMPYAPPIGTIVGVHFYVTYDETGDTEGISMNAEVVGHHYLNPAVPRRAVGMRFLGFAADTGEPSQHVQ